MEIPDGDDSGLVASHQVFAVSGNSDRCDLTNYLLILVLGGQGSVALDANLKERNVSEGSADGQKLAPG